MPFRRTDPLGDSAKALEAAGSAVGTTSRDGAPSRAASLRTLPPWRTTTCCAIDNLGGAQLAGRPVRTTLGPIDRLARSRARDAFLKPSNQRPVLGLGAVYSQHALDEVDERIARQRARAADPQPFIVGRDDLHRRRTRTRRAGIGRNACAPFGRLEEDRSRRALDPDAEPAVFGWFEAAGQPTRLHSLIFPARRRGSVDRSAPRWPWSNDGVDGLDIVARWELNRNGG